MTLAIICGALGGSLIFAVLVGRGIKLADDAEQPQYPPPVPPFVRRMKTLPPVPPSDRLHRIEVAEGWAAA